MSSPHDARGYGPAQERRNDEREQMKHKKRLGLIAHHVRGAKPDVSFHAATSTTTRFPPASVSADGLDLEAMCSAAERDVIRKTRAFATTHVAPVICSYWERAQFPFELVPKFAELNIGGGTLPTKYGCQNMSMMSCGVAVVELARVDGSISTFYLVHSFLAALTIGMLGTEAQKREWLPHMANFAKVGAWALTEPSNGSDASSLMTTATKVPNGWRLRGRKRWIGNATFADVVIVWARSSVDGEINGFIVRKENPGMRTTKIENKVALRCVQNADIELTDAFVPDSDRLNVSSFGDTNKVLAMSRIMVAWQPVGLAFGCYDAAKRYVLEREQFGTPLASFQLIQEKLQRMLSTATAMWLMAWRVTKLAETGEVTHEQASLVKAWTTLRGREVVSLGREVLGGNGVVSDFLVAKAFCDCEAYYSYEGTYEINALVAGRGITGVSAIKSKGRASRRPQNS